MFDIRAKGSPWTKGLEDAKIRPKVCGDHTLDKQLVVSVAYRVQPLLFQLTTPCVINGRMKAPHVREWGPKRASIDSTPMRRARMFAVRGCSACRPP